MIDDRRTRLIAARERMGLSTREMAWRLETPRQTYEQWERGDRRTPGIAVVAAEAIAGQIDRDIALDVASAAGPKGRPTARIGHRNRDRIQALADGTRTRGEIAALVGCSLTTVHYHLRAIQAADPARNLVRHGQPRGAVTKRVEGLLDGTRSTAQVAAEAACSTGMVARIVAKLRAQGRTDLLRRKPPAPERPPRPRPKRDRIAVARRRQMVLELADGTRTAREIATLTGIHISTLHNDLRLLREAGKPAKTRTHLQTGSPDTKGRCEQ